MLVTFCGEKIPKCFHRHPITPLQPPWGLQTPIKCWCYLQKFMSYSLNLMSFIFPTWSEENIATQMIKQREIVDVSRWISSCTKEIRLGKRGVCLPDTDKVITHNTLYIFSFFFSEHCTIMSCEATEHQSRSHIAVVWRLTCVCVFGSSGLEEASLFCWLFVLLFRV